MDYLLIDDKNRRENLLPMTYTRPVAELRIGILTLREKWQRMLPGSYSYEPNGYLSEIFPIRCDRSSDDTVSIASDVIPTPDLASAIASLAPGQALYDSDDNPIAVRGAEQTKLTTGMAVRRVENLTDIFTLNGVEIEADFARPLPW